MTDQGAYGPRQVRAEPWCRFFDFGNLGDEALDERWCDDRIVHVEYGDFECFWSHLIPDPHKWSFYNVPSTPLPSRTTRAPSLSAGAMAIFAELDDRDVIMGSRQRMDAVVAKAKQRAGRAKLLMMNNLCMPVVIGDDLEQLARRCHEACGRPVLQNTRQIKDEGGLFARTLCLVRDTAGFAKQQADPSKVNLFGFPKRYRDEELAPLLGRLGLEINAAIAPDIVVAAIERIPQARYNVVCMPTRSGRDVLDRLGDLPRQWLEVSPPYGPRASRRCLEALARTVAREQDFESIVTATHESMRARWDELAERARRHRLAFVVNAADASTLTEPGRLELPILSLLGEMGFGVDVLCAGSAAIRLVGDLAQQHHAQDVEVHPYSSRTELQELLRLGEFRAVYSDYSLDWRISRAGKGQFSQRNFEMGLLGAVRTLASLVAVCELPFYARYARHLPPPRRSSHD